MYDLSDFLKNNVQIELLLCITLWKLWITITKIIRNIRITEFTCNLWLYLL